MAIGKVASFLNQEVPLETTRQCLLVAAVITVFSILLLAGLYWTSYNYIFGPDTRSALEFAVDIHGNNPAEKALAYYMEGETVKAQKILSGLVKDEPENVNAIIYYGLVLADQRHYDQAIVHLEKALALKPLGNPLTYLYLGISYYETKQLNEGLKALENAVKLDPGSAAGHYYLGLTYNEKGMKKEAIAALQKALVLSGNYFPEASRELTKISR